MKLRKLVVAVAAAVAVTAGSAAIAADGAYVKLQGGVGMASDIKDTINANRIEDNTKAGYAVAGAVGYNSGPLGYELELGYLHNKIDEYKVNGVAVAGANGAHKITIGMANVYYNFQNMSSQFVPYLGAGIGIASNSTSLDVTGRDNRVEASDSAFAYQLMAGVNYKLDQNWMVGANYTFLGTGDFDYKDNVLSTTVKAKEAYYNNSLNLNLTYNF